MKKGICFTLWDSSSEGKYFWEIKMTALAPCKETISQTYIINYNRAMEKNSKSKYTIISSVEWLV